eukprot:Gregarina_sp_Poly_1__7548@NODE_4223_length_680_cov_114_698206_g2788_i0_p1_GENE_NODE_4223_length_680_cov_114_698206_g2788_i0NODE_4223_length_680_cov_114_698206_g2788_i0_p1_ORF_typecomplete_len174_score16_15Glyco_trans_4_4/PF13579_6/0_077_NODE_4223_length_680_cov_114_698206_g2788_i096617
MGSQGLLLLNAFDLFNLHNSILKWRDFTQSDRVARAHRYTQIACFDKYDYVGGSEQSSPPARRADDGVSSDQSQTLGSRETKDSVVGSACEPSDNRLIGEQTEKKFSLLRIRFGLCILETVLRNRQRQIVRRLEKQVCNDARQTSVVHNDDIDKVILAYTDKDRVCVISGEAR